MTTGACLVFKALPNLRQSLPRPPSPLTRSTGHFLSFLLPFRSRQIKTPSIRFSNMRTEEPFLLSFALELESTGFCFRHAIVDNSRRLDLVPRRLKWNLVPNVSVGCLWIVVSLSFALAVSSVGLLLKGKERSRV